MHIMGYFTNIEMIHFHVATLHLLLLISHVIMNTRGFNLCSRQIKFQKLSEDMQGWPVHPLYSHSWEDFTEPVVLGLCGYGGDQAKV